MSFENGRLLRVVLRARKGNDQQVNVLHYDLVDSTWPLHDNDPQTLANTLRDAVLPKFALLYGSSWSIDPIYIVEEKDPQDPNAPRSAWGAGVQQLGQKSTETTLMPRACCMVVNLKTEYVGRRYTGRMFLGGSLTENDHQDGMWTIPAAYTTFLAAIPREPDITSGVSSSTAKWCVYSRTSRKEGESPYTAAITSAVPDSRVHWLRSREG